MADAVSEKDGAALVRVRLTPCGGADRIEGLAHDSAGAAHLKARVRAPPENGEANAALEALLAKALKLPRGAVRVAKGQTARVKIVEIDGRSAAEVRTGLNL